MQLSNAPAKIVLPFANSGAKNTIPVPSQIPITPGAASYTDGFPPLTMEPVPSGGIPPDGLDFNGILNELSAPARWYNAGAGYVFDSVFAAAVGGYPKGARVLSSDGSGYWISTIENNSNDPDAGGAGWAPESLKAIASVYASAQQTLLVGSAKIIFDTVEFDARGLWNAGSHRFVAKWAGKYRVSGAVLLNAPDGQNLATQIWVNGALAKECFRSPQVSDVDLSLPFEAVISLTATDYVDAYLNVTQANVLAGLVGSNQPYVFAQIEYLGQ
jgi:hypothetical protein